MKILVGYVNRLHSSGVDNYLLNVLTAAKEKGISLDFLTSREDVENERELALHGCRLFKVRNLKNPLGHYRDVKNILKTSEYDKAYFNISEPLNMMGAIAAHDCAVPCIVHAHSSGMDIADKKKRMIRGFINDLCRPVLTRAADVCVACSRKSGEWMYTRKALNSDRFHVVYNSVDISDFHPDPISRTAKRKELGIDSNTLTVGHIGGYTYVKNSFFLADIAKKMADIRPDSVMICVGDGDMRQAVQEYAVSIGADKNMRFLGIRRDIPELMSAMDVFILPSHFEGAPLSVLEAQAVGVPCVVSNGVPDEVVISSAVTKLSLDSAVLWAETIVDMSEHCEKTELSPEISDRYSLDAQKQTIIDLLS